MFPQLQASKKCKSHGSLQMAPSPQPAYATNQIDPYCGTNMVVARERGKERVAAHVAMVTRTDIDISQLFGSPGDQDE